MDNRKHLPSGSKRPHPHSNSSDPSKRARSSSASSSSQPKKKSDFFCDMRYVNTLPDLPFDPKFLLYPYNRDRLISYKPTSLERSYVRPMITDPTLGINIEVIDPDAYLPVDNPRPLSPIDEELLNDTAKSRSKPLKKETNYNPNVSWLRKTEYMTAEVEQVYGRDQVGIERKDDKKEEVTREERLERIAKSFEEVKLKPVHPVNPKMEPEVVIPLMPCFDYIAFNPQRVSFDEDPTPKPSLLGLTPADKKVLAEATSKAILRSVTVEGEKHALFAVPLPENRQKSENGEVDGEVENVIQYVQARTYVYETTQSTDPRDCSFLFILTPNNEALFCPVPSAMSCKRKSRAAHTGDIVLMEKAENMKEKWDSAVENHKMELIRVAQGNDEEE